MYILYENYLIYNYNFVALINICKRSLRFWVPVIERFNSFRSTEPSVRKSDLHLTVFILIWCGGLVLWFFEVFY